MLSFTRRVRAVYDTNIWVSALRRQGNPFRCALLAAMGFAVSVTCDELLDKLCRVLMQKFGMPFANVNRYIAVIRSFSEAVAITGQLRVVVDDPDDDKVIECALVGKADYIVTGDRHLLALGQYNGISIVKAAQFLNILGAQ